MTTLRHLFDNARDARDFILAGNATITAVSKATGVRFTYRVRKPKEQRGPVSHFVSIMNGPDNESSFQYLGHVKNGAFEHGRKSRVSTDAPSAKAFAWVFNQIAHDTMPPTLEVWHEGRCGRCGRKLTVPASIARGLGPECAGRNA